MATFANLQYNKRMLMDASDEVIGALDHGGNNQKWQLSIQGEDPNYSRYVINSGTHLFMGWDDAKENITMGDERYVWKFVIDWAANTIGFQIPGSSDDPDTFFTAQLENDQSTIKLVVQSGELTKIQKWTRDPRLEH